MRNPIRSAARRLRSWKFQLSVNIPSHSRQKNGGNTDEEKNLLWLTLRYEFVRICPTSRTSTDNFRKSNYWSSNDFFAPSLSACPLHLCRNACLTITVATFGPSWYIFRDVSSIRRRENPDADAILVDVRLSFDILASLSSRGHHRISCNTYRLFPAIVWKC